MQFQRWKEDAFKPIARAVRNGLIMTVPVVLIGSFALLLETLPIPSYIQFLSSFCGGTFARMLSFIETATSGMVSAYMAVLVSVSYFMETGRDGSRTYIGAPITAFASFCICIGFLSDGFQTAMFSGRGMFAALLAGISSSLLYAFFERRIRTPRTFFAAGTDMVFNSAISTIMPSLCVILIFAAFNYAVTVVFGVSCIQDLFVRAVNGLFAGMERSFFSGLLFIFCSSALWFFGIHGNNVLDTVVQDLFSTVSCDAILSKTFFDVFVLMGGCGTMLGLLAAIFLFSRRPMTRRLAKLSWAPILFNINELMVFGLPIIYNRYFVLPFILAPLAACSISYLATWLGLVPAVCNSVTWTTPFLLSGWIATGSWRGALLQLVNVAAAVLLYRPFVLMYDRRSAGRIEAYMKALVGALQESEDSSRPVTLTELKSPAGFLAKSLVGDLQELLAADGVALKYQPQFRADGTCVGAEALLRWNHPVYGMIYPPLVVKLAKESGCLWQLESQVLSHSMADYALFSEAYGGTFKLSVNITVASLYEKGFVEFLAGLAERFSLRPGTVCLEVTEEMALRSDAETEGLFRRIKALGFLLALDDFSMGHTSLQYLQNNQFDLVKLDGSLVRAMKEKPRSREIIASIVYLAKSLDFSVLAEFVETDEQRQELEKIGCLLYQGYLYSPAVSAQELASPDFAARLPKP